MEESNTRTILELIRGLISGCLGLYMASTVVFFFYFNYFVNSPTHPFSEVNAAGKAIVWPYILFFKKNEHETQAKATTTVTVPPTLRRALRARVSQALTSY